MGFNAITLGIWAASGITSVPVWEDPYWSNVVVLLHGDSLTDSSSSPRKLTNKGVTINKTTKKYGSGSLYFDGNSYLNLTDGGATVFGSGAFTIEFWLNMPSYAVDTALVSRWGPLSGFLLVVTSVNLAIYLNSYTPVICAHGGLLTNVFNHIAISRTSSGVVRMFVNGSQIGSDTVNANSVGTNGKPLTIGANNDGYGAKLTGYIDDLRITKGVARYTSNFTPPTQAFPNS